MSLREKAARALIAVGRALLSRILILCYANPNVSNRFCLPLVNSNSFAGFASNLDFFCRFRPILQLSTNVRFISQPIFDNFVTQRRMLIIQQKIKPFFRTISLWHLTRQLFSKALLPSNTLLSLASKLVFFFIW